MLKKYEELKVTVLLFSGQDAIRTSGVESDIYGKPETDPNEWQGN